MDPKTREIFKSIFLIAKNIATTLDVDILLKKISALAEEHLSSEASSIMLLDEDKKNLSFKVASGTKGGIIQRMKVPVGHGIAGWVAENKKPTIVNDVSMDPRFTGVLDKSSGFMTRMILCVPMLIENELIGIVEVLNKKEGQYTLDDQEILATLADLAAVSIHNAKLSEDQRNFFVNMLEVLVAAIEAQDNKLLGHHTRVTQLTTMIGRHMGLTGKEYKDLYYGAMLHDIGRLFVKGNKVITEGIFITSGSDIDIDTKHPSIGASMLEPINLLKGAAVIIKHHHENYDGTGFPDGLSGEQIPLASRILYVAETIDEMKANGMDDATVNKMLAMGKEIRFDPKIVDVYISEIAGQ